MHVFFYFCHYLVPINWFLLIDGVFDFYLFDIGIEFVSIITIFRKLLILVVPWNVKHQLFTAIFIEILVFVKVYVSDDMPLISLVRISFENSVVGTIFLFLVRFVVFMFHVIIFFVQKDIFRGFIVLRFRCIPF